MKLGFKFKALAAGAMLLCGGSALANTNIDITNGDIFLNLWDQTTGTTFVYDTGLNQNTFSGTGSYQFNVADANYTAFMNAVGGTDTVTYNLISLGGGAYTTSTVAPNPKNAGLNNALSAGSTYAESVNAVTSSTTNSAYVTGASPDAEWGSTDAQWTSFIKANPNANAAVGSALSFYSVQFNGTNLTSGFVNALVTSLGSTWLLTSAGQLTYGAVPVPAPFGLLLGGLALMGAISRRKSNAAEQEVSGAAA